VSPHELPPEERILEVIAGLAEAWAPGGAPVGLLKKVLDHEPLKAPGMPLLTIKFDGFTRARLESRQQASPVHDPLMGRRWIWDFSVRVWVGFKNDVAAAQRRLNVLVPQVVLALESDRTLKGVSVDAAMETGRAAIVRPKDGNAVLMLESTVAVETEEPL
jgi:hypothetical protein